MQIGVVYTPPGPGIAMWTYYVTDSAGFDRIAITLDVPCPVPTSPGGATMLPASGNTKIPTLIYPVSRTSDKITLSCDAQAGGTATFKVMTVPAGSTTVTASTTLAVLGPK